MIDTLLAHNIAYLEQAHDLVTSLDDAAFVATRPPVHHSGVGDHLRHILEHYEALVKGWQARRIDYDGRARDPHIASDRAVAGKAIKNLIRILSGMPTLDAALDVRLDGGSCEPDADPWSRSTLKRELQYLQAHTVHHFALIGFILQLQGITPDPRFGLAPSTLRHRRSQAVACES